jgi:hypothetical protein
MLQSFARKIQKILPEKYTDSARRIQPAFECSSHRYERIFSSFLLLFSVLFWPAEVCSTVFFIQALFTTERFIEKMRDTCSQMLLSLLFSFSSFLTLLCTELPWFDDC